MESCPFGTSQCALNLWDMNLTQKARAFISDKLSKTNTLVKEAFDKKLSLEMRFIIQRHLRDRAVVWSKNLNLKEAERSHVINLIYTRAKTLIENEKISLDILQSF